MQMRQAAHVRCRENPNPAGQTPFPKFVHNKIQTDFMPNPDPKRIFGAYSCSRTLFLRANPSRRHSTLNVYYFEQTTAFE
jgi:hypothetical protein